jgi:hypothetical protein
MKRHMAQCGEKIFYSPKMNDWFSKRKTVQINDRSEKEHHPFFSNLRNEF